MISLIFTQLLFITFLFSREKEKGDSEEHFNIFALSLSLSIALIGLIGFFLVMFKITNFPILPISSLSFFLTLLIKKNRENLKIFQNNFVKDFKSFFLNKKYNLIFGVVIFLHLFASFGPINHSDAVNAYVGYPYQFWLKNSHYIDGDFHQGLLGITDFANIIFFQEKTIWFIRLSQFLPIIPISLLLHKRGTSRLIILIILTSPAFIQWLTIGKYFFAEACVALSFIVWSDQRNLRNTIFLLSTIIVSIAFKFTSLITAFPIIIYLILNFWPYYESFFNKNLVIKNLKKLNHNYFYIPFFISIFSLIVILQYKYMLTNNPFHPLLNNVFNPDNKDLSLFSEVLFSWRRDPLYPLWIFVPRNFAKIGSVLGPSTLLIFLKTIPNLFQKYTFKNKNFILIGLTQIILLLIFCQGRADYYYCPLILTCVGFTFKNKVSNNLSPKYSVEYFLLKGINISAIIQLFLFICICLYSISITFFTVINYESGMKYFAWNYYNSKVINDELEHPITNLIFENSRLFVDHEFVSSQRFNSCVNSQNVKNKNESYKNCMKKLGIKTIVVRKNSLDSEKIFNCETKKQLYVSRNIILEKTLKRKGKRNYEADFCKIKQI